MKKCLLLFAWTALSIGSACAQNLPFDFDWKRSADNTSQELVAINKRQLGTFSLFIEFREVVNARVQRRYTVLVRNSGDRILKIEPIDKERPMDFDLASADIARGYHSNKLDSAFVYHLPYSTSKQAVKVSDVYSLNETDLGGKASKGWKVLQFELEKGDTIFAMRKGLVVEVIDQYDMSPEEMGVAYNSQSNNITIEHSDGTIGTYEVFERGSMLVKEGQTVYPGTPLGLAGSFSENGNYMVRFYITYPELNRNYKEDDPNSRILETVYYNPHFLTADGVRQLSSGETYRSASSPELVQREMSKREIKAIADQVYSYPAPGYRHYSSGVSEGIGNNERSWSSTISGSNISYSWFSYTNISPSGTWCRGMGYLVRCLRE